MKVKVKGLTVIKYVGMVTHGHNCEFEDVPEELERYVLHCVDVNQKHNGRIDICLEETFGECCSGWTTASWGVMDVERNPKPMPWTHMIISKETIVEFDPYSDDVKNEVFSFSAYGGDEYYPSGGVSVNEELFTKAFRTMKKRPVWIFKGESGLGKSTIGAAISDDLSVYETDCADELPDVITDDVVVLGNRSDFTINDVKSRLFGEPQVIVVDFGKED